MKEQHIPVLLEEVVQGLQVKEGGVYVDGTIGYGGHTQALLQQGKKIRVIGFDRDEQALAACKKRLAPFKKQVTLIHSSYANAYEELQERGIEQVDGILLDLGASSPQFDQPERGFSFQKPGPLDMRFDLSGSTTAAEIVNTYPVKRLTEILKTLGEERHASRIAKAIERARKEAPIQTTQELAFLVENALPRKFWPKHIHPATRTFQALRIEVNQELEQLKEALPKLVQLLKPGARLAIISFHSLEDRIVKQFFREAAKICVCPKEFPVCRCDKEASLRVLTKKPIAPTKTKINENVRARSSKLRIAERI